MTQINHFAGNHLKHNLIFQANRRPWMSIIEFTLTYLIITISGTIIGFFELIRKY